MLRVFVLTLLFVTLVHCAPADEPTTTALTTTTTTVATTSKPADERAVVAGDTSWASMIPANAWPIATWGLGGASILGGLGYAVYHFYYQKYYNNLDESASGYTAYNYPYSQQYSQYPYNGLTAAVGRALDETKTWNWSAVLELIDMAQETYEKFDFQSLDCQKKALCDLAQKQNEFGETGRKISSSVTYMTNVSKRYMDILEGLPIPQIIKTYLKEYSSAINQGKVSSKDCSIYYPKCQFAIKETFVKVQKKINQL